MTYPLATNRHEVIEEFQKIWFDEPNKHPYTCWDGVTWRGIKMVKDPNDLLRYAMLIHVFKPTCIIETGSGYGGSALFFHEMGRCHVLSIDVVANRREYPQIVGVTFAGGVSSTDKDIVYAIQNWMQRNNIHGYGGILVSLDSDHTAEHVYQELEIYSKIAQYIVVEDTQVNGHPTAPQHGAGPWEAVAVWLPENSDEWVEDHAIRERFLFSANTWLKRKMIHT